MQKHIAFSYTTAYLNKASRYKKFLFIRDGSPFLYSHIVNPLKVPFTFTYKVSTCPN